jgi:membrane carboxypeptidase/penicillin-binding protein
MDRGTGRTVKLYNGHSMAGKTGTTESNKAVWFAGYTPEIAAVSMISYDKRRKPFINKARSGIKGYTIPSTGFYLNGSGSGDAGVKIWKPVMAKYLKSVPDTNFNQPPRRIQVGKQVRVPSLYNMSLGAATRKLEKAGFNVEKAYVYSDSVPEFGFIGWSPGPGASVSQFGTVYATYSRGRDPQRVAEEKRERAQAKKKAAAEKKKREKKKPGE